MIRVTANVYLDQRKPEWVDAELNGHVYYDGRMMATAEGPKFVGSRLVEINDSCPEIQRACGGAV